jgi:hypothetical protein
MSRNEGRWNAVFGATVSALMREYLAKGHGWPDDARVRLYIAEAQAVAGAVEKCMPPADEKARGE